MLLLLNEDPLKVGLRKLSLWMESCRGMNGMYTSVLEIKVLFFFTSRVCNDSFHKFASTPIKELSSQDDSNFFVSIFPYTAFIYEQYMTASRSAINITFVINHQVPCF
ncbi:UNVERIFIED_CONTAM: hypothetical protein NCL1_34463 [Trichonephila clavipes]